MKAAISNTSEARGAAAYSGTGAAPPPWRLLVGPRGNAFADTSPVNSSAGRWPATYKGVEHET